jgi:hypothetical protein
MDRTIHKRCAVITDSALAGCGCPSRRRGWPSLMAGVLCAQAGCGVEGGRDADACADATGGCVGAQTAVPPPCHHYLERRTSGLTEIYLYVVSIPMPMLLSRSRYIDSLTVVALSDPKVIAAPPTHHRWISSRWWRVPSMCVRVVTAGSLWPGRSSTSTCSAWKPCVPVWRGPWTPPERVPPPRHDNNHEQNSWVD